MGNHRGFGGSGSSGGGLSGWRIASPQLHPHRVAMLRYPDFRAAGYPVGSGTVESAARNVVQPRMRRPGRGWQRDNADAMWPVSVNCIAAGYDGLGTVKLPPSDCLYLALYPPHPGIGTECREKEEAWLAKAREATYSSREGC